MRTEASLTTTAFSKMPSLSGTHRQSSEEALYIVYRRGNVNINDDKLLNGKPMGEGQNCSRLCLQKNQLEETLLTENGLITRQVGKGTGSLRSAIFFSDKGTIYHLGSLKSQFARRNGN